LRAGQPSRRSEQPTVEIGSKTLNWSRRGKFARIIRTIREDRSGAVWRAAQKVVRLGCVDLDHRVSGASSRRTYLNLENYVFWGVMAQKKKLPPEQRLKILRGRMLTPEDIGRRLRKKEKE
jgi:hypothetical protein